MKNFFILLLTLTPFALFASDGAETDIVQRTVNFIIFAAILYYLLADKLKAFFAERTQSIQSELDKVQDALKESAQKVEDAKTKLEDSRKLAAEIVEGANNEIQSIKTQIASNIDSEISNLHKTFDDKIEVEVRKAKSAVVKEVLEELLQGDIGLSQDELANIVLKKVA